MKMTRSREILAIILQCIVTACTAVLIFSFVLNLTFASTNYYSSKFPSAKLAAQCDAQLTLKYEALAKESGFPVRVFEMIKEDMSTSENVKRVTAGFAEGNKVDLYSQNLVDYFYNLCKEYAEGNELDYNESDIKLTAEKAARIYCETVEIGNIQSANQKMKELKHNVTLWQLLSFVSVVGCGFAIVLMYSRKRLGFYHFMGGTLGGGVGTLGASLLLYFIKPVSNMVLYPQIITECLGDMSKKYFMITAMISVAIIVVSLIIMIQFERKYIKDKDKVKVV